LGELVLITGCSSGIGLSAAVECAAAGHRVVATMRDPERRKALLETAEARGVAVHVEQLDVTSAGVLAKIRELTLKYGPIYAVVNNAGVTLGGAFEEQGDADVRAQFDTNVFGMMAVTRAALPSMRAAQRGRIINISSLLGRVAFPMLSVYAASKHAVEGFSEALRWEVEPFGVEVCLVEPGTFRSAISFGERLGERRGAGVSASGPPTTGPGAAPTAGLLRSPYRALAEAIEKMVAEDAGQAPAPDAVGKAIAALVSDPAPRFRTVIGIDARTLVTLRRMVPDRLFASGIRRLLHLQRSR
jgi:NAD(P)-dependent dehydrogenase (short-subunit alcohol dehydrogenase family)